MQVTNEIDSEARASRRQATLQRSSNRGLTMLASLVVLAMIGAAGVYLWFNFSRLAEASSAPEPPPAAAAVDTGVLKDIQSQQQQAASEMDSLKQSIATQQADLGRISDQLSALAARVDSLQNPPPPPPPPVAEARTAAPPVREASKKPPHAASRPVGPVSVGGAPLKPEAEQR